MYYIVLHLAPESSTDMAIWAVTHICALRVFHRGKDTGSTETRQYRIEWLAPQSGSRAGSGSIADTWSTEQALAGRNHRTKRSDFP
jgi:hypothetical protein